MRVNVARGTAGTLAGFLLFALLAGAPARGAALFGLVNTGEIYRSSDGGTSWNGIATLPVHDAVALSARLSTSDLFLATRSGSVYRSLNAGVDWAAVGALPASDVEDLAIRPDGALLALTATGSLYLSIDLGANFTALAALTGSNFISLSFVTPAVAYFALTRTGEVYRSVDGAAWSAVGSMPTSTARRIRAVGSTLFVVSDEGDVYRSTDSGANWVPVGTLSQVGTRGLVRNAGALAAATQEGHVATSADGATWSWRGSINQLALTALASDEPASTSVGTDAAGSVAFSAPWPNPSRGESVFAVTLEREDDVALALYDLSGRRVAERARERLGPGVHPIAWAPAVEHSGLYFARLESTAGAISRRWLIVR